MNSDLFSRGLALLAFVLAFYTLAARERKTPYLARSIYAIIWFVFASILLSAVAPIVARFDETWGGRMGQIAWLTLGGGMLYVVVGVWTAYNRQANFRDDGLVKHLVFVRWCKNIWRGIKGRGSTYELHPIKFSDGLIQALRESPYLDKPDVENIEKGTYLSAGAQIKSFHAMDRVLTDLAVRFLEHGCWVQYTGCMRHPINFVEALQEEWAKDKGRKDWKEIAKQVVVVDAYTPHFGFTDSIYWDRTKRLAKMDIHAVKSHPTYAGIHTASAKAFNHIKKLQGGQLRQPALLIYEGCFALVDLESLEQYRIFIRHVLPSERLWGSMFTVVIEGDIPDQQMDTVNLYADIKLKTEKE